MAPPYEWMFSEVMWRTWAERVPYPVPWWLRPAFRRRSDADDGGPFDSKEPALASNARYRDRNMVDFKDHGRESPVGQAGEIEPVYGNYAVTFFVFGPDGRRPHRQLLGAGPAPKPRHRPDGGGCRAAAT